jgi:hypothetical protein
MIDDDDETMWLVLQFLVRRVPQDSEDRFRWLVAAFSNAARGVDAQTSEECLERALVFTVLGRKAEAIRTWRICKRLA